MENHHLATARQIWSNKTAYQKKTGQHPHPGVHTIHSIKAGLLAYLHSPLPAFPCIAQWHWGRFVRFTAAGAAPDCLGNDLKISYPKSPDFPFHSGAQTARQRTEIEWVVYLKAQATGKQKIYGIGI